MFRRLSISKGLIAFLLPLTFAWSWAACLLVCSEITERHEKQSVSIIDQSGETCLMAVDLETCPMTATTAVIEARQTVADSGIDTEYIAASPANEFLFIPASIYPADVHQNSPPRAASDPPLFLRNCTFRI